MARAPRERRRRPSKAPAPAAPPRARESRPEPAEEKVATLPFAVPPDPEAAIAALDLDIQSAHAVCRRCGRIAPAPIPPELERGLRLMVARHPTGWSIDGLSITVMGLCRRCREGPVY
jgi:hypothetical protein